MNNQNTEEKMSFEERLAVLRGEDLQIYREECTIRSRIREESQKYIDAPVSQWPDISMNWDLSRESQRFSLDGTSQEDFEKYYSKGFLLGYVDLLEFDRILCHHSRRDDGELWEVGRKSELAYLIVYLSEGRPISPPLVKPLDTNEVIFNGGHHRYAIAKVIGISELPIYVEPEYKEKIDNLLNIRWVNV